MRKSIREQANEGSTAPQGTRTPSQRTSPRRAISRPQRYDADEAASPWPSRLPGMDTDQGGQSGAVPLQLRRLQELQAAQAPLSRRYGPLIARHSRLARCALYVVMTR